MDVLNAMPENHRFIRGMVSWIGFPQEAIPYHRAERFLGETKYPLSKMIRFAFDAITGFSVRPLRIASYLGLISGASAAAMTLYALAAWLRGQAVEGWTSLTMIVLFIGGCQLMVAGLMGEYLGRLYIESKRRPLYIVQDIVRASVTTGQPAVTVDAREVAHVSEPANIRGAAPATLPAIPA
ncbi:MAG TPA: hypothetical protein VFG62_16210 [Rhodopila sp.]|nr:hypothetical protein [Rhodopila sp.]